MSFSVDWNDSLTGQAEDINTAQSPTFTHTFSQAGTYTPLFTAINSNGQANHMMLSVNVGNVTTTTTQTPSLSVSLDFANPVAQTVSPGSMNVPLFALDFNATGGNVSLNQISVGVKLATSNVNASSVFSDIKVYDGSTLIGVGNTNGGTPVFSNYNPTDNTEWGSINFNSPLTITQGSIKVLTIKADLNPSTTGNLQLSVVGLGYPTLPQFSGTLPLSGNMITISSTIPTPSIQPTVSVFPSSLNFTIQQGNTNPFSYPVSHVTFTVNPNQLVNWSAQASQSWISTASSGSAQSTGTTFVFLGSSVASLSPGTYSGNIAFSGNFPTQNVTVNLTVNATTVSAQTSVTILPTLNIPMSSASQTAPVGINGSPNFSKATYNFVASGGTATITELKFSVTDTNTVSSISVGGVSAAVVNGVADATGLNILAPNNGSGINQDVYISYPGVGVNGIPSGSTSRIALEYIKFTSNGTTTTMCTSAFGSCTQTLTAVPSPVMTLVSSTTTPTSTQPSVSVSPASFNFSATQGGANPVSQVFTTNVSSASGAWITSVSLNQSWLSTNLVGGVYSTYNGSNFYVNINSSALSSGTYNGSITIAGNFTGSSINIPVTLTVN